MGQRNPNGLGLPLEMMDEILSWLPVKSLCRFRCVSKPWRNLISDPKFVKMHGDRAIQNEHVFRQRQRVIYTNRPLTHRSVSNKIRPFSIYSFDLNSNIATLSEYDFVPTKLNHVFSSKLKRFVISWVSCCNGLLLCKLHGQGVSTGLYLLNPATRESKELPLPPKLQDNHFRKQLYGFGFGDEYKVVNGQMYIDHDHDHDDDDDHTVTVFSVYTLKTGCWRAIEKQFPYKGRQSYDGIPLNGGLHWLMYRLDPLGGYTLVIVSLLLAEEEVREIPLPVERPIENCSMVLGVFRQERLFITRTRPGLYNDIWIMMEYGVAESWTKMRVAIPYCNLSKFCFWDKSSWVLVVQGEKLSMHNFVENYFRNLSICGIGKVGSVGIYLESLVSLNDADL